MVRSLRSRSKRGLIALFAATLMGLPVNVRAQEPQQPGDPFPFIGGIDYVKPNGEPVAEFVLPGGLVVDEGLGKLVASVGSDIYLLDTLTLEQAGFVEAPPSIPATGIVALDAKQHRVFYGEFADSTSCIFLDTSCLSPRRIKVFSLIGAFNPGAFTFPATLGGHGVKALSYDSTKDRLYALTYTKPCCPLPGAPVAGEATLHALDASKLLTDPSAALVWSQRITSCGEPIGNPGRDPYLGIGTTGRFLFLACRGLGPFTFGGQATLNGVIRVNLDQSDKPAGEEFYPFAAPLDFGNVFGDRGSDRIVVVPSGGRTNRIYVFDALRRSWVGSVPMGDTNVMGAVADPRTGRLYAVDQGWDFEPEQTQVLASDGAQLPVSQGQRHSLGVYVSFFGHPTFDPVTRRLFIPGPRFITPGGESVFDHLRVYEDRTPILEQPPPRDPDDDTNQIVEVPGRTPITFSGSASAYGSREIFVGGQRAITGNPADPGTQQDFFAWVQKTEVSSSAATASAIRSAQSSETEQDTLSKQSSCKDFGGTEDKRTDTNSGSEVSCDLENLTASGSSTASNDSSPTDSPVTVSSSWSTVKVFKDPDRGTVAKASAAAKGITIAGLIRIGEVQVDAETWAHGRDGTADSTFNTTIKEFVSAGLSCGFGNDTCDPQAVAAEINRTFGSRIQAFVPPRDLDPEVKGSDGGAQSIIVKDPYWYWSEFNVNNDAQKEVPGLQIVQYNDQREPSRRVIHLAAVFAESHYGIGLPPVEPPPEPALLKIVLTDDSEPPQPLPGGTFEVYADKDGNGVIDPLTDSVIQGGRCTTHEDGTGNCLFEELAAGDYVVHEAAAPGGYAPGPDTPVELLPGFAATATFINLPAIGFIDASLTDDSEPPKPLSGGSLELYADNGDLTLGAGDQRLATCATNELGECMFNSKSVKGEAVVVQCKRTQGSAKPDCTYDPDATEGNTLVVPLGTFIAREATAPGDYLPGEDRYETLASPYSQAHFRFVNGLKGIEGTSGTPGVSGSGGSTTPGTTVSVEEGTGSPQAKVTQQPLEPSEPNILLRIIRLPADIWRFLQRHPMEALLFGLLWMLLGLPLWLAHRRRLGWLVARSATY